MTAGKIIDAGAVRSVRSGFGMRTQGVDNVTARPKAGDFSQFKNVAVFFFVFFQTSFFTRLLPA